MLRRESEREKWRRRGDEFRLLLEELLERRESIATMALAVAANSEMVALKGSTKESAQPSRQTGDFRCTHYNLQSFGLLQQILLVKNECWLCAAKHLNAAQANMQGGVAVEGGCRMPHPPLLTYALVLCGCCAGVVRVLCDVVIRAGVVWVLCWYCAGVVRVLCGCCAVIVRLLCWCCAGVVLFCPIFVTTPTQRKFGATTATTTQHNEQAAQGGRATQG